jgi:hypothetical protein
MGVIVKKIADRLGLAITMGRPYINHSKASDPLVNLVKEAPGIKFHENFWETIHNIKLIGHTVQDCMWEVGHGLCQSEDEFGYAPKLGEAIKIWLRLVANP